VAASQKHTFFALKNGNSDFYEAKPETLFGRDVCNEKVHTLDKFGRFITLYARVLRSTQSLGWKSLVKPYLSGRVVCNEKVHTLAMFGRFITLYAHVLRSTWSIGWKYMEGLNYIGFFLPNSLKQGRDNPPRFSLG
jgi:hypothetical protein